MDLNRIVQEYRIERKNAARNLALLREKLRDVPVSFNGLSSQPGDASDLLADLVVTAELVHPQGRILLIDNLPHTSADYAVEEIELPYARVRISGETYGDQFYRYHRQASEWIAPLEGATLFAGGARAGLMFFRNKRLQYVEFSVEKRLL